MTATTTTPDLTALSGEYVVDATHSRIGFVARHAMITKVRGDFTAFEGRAVLDFADPTRSTAEAVIEVASVDTRNEQRDEHLRTNDFFDAATFPQITFRSTGVEVVDADNVQVTGDLTIKGTTRPVVLDVEVSGASKDPFGNTRVGFEGRTTVNRKDFGLTWNAALETGGVLVSEKVVLELEVSAVKVEVAAQDA